MRYLFIVPLILAPLSVCAEDKKADMLCHELLKRERDLADRLPIKIDNNATLSQFTVNCEDKKTKFVKVLSGYSYKLKDGSFARSQRHFLNLHCGRTGLATNGWTVEDSVFDSSLNLVMQLIATPQMCKERDKPRQV